MPAARPVPPAADDVQDELARARAELAKLGVTLEDTLDERVYRALLELPPKLGRPCQTRDLIDALGAPNRFSVQNSLDRLRAAGRVINLRRGVWVALTGG